MYLPPVVPYYQRSLRPVDDRTAYMLFRQWPVYQPPRWRCDACGQEQLLPDDGNRRYHQLPMEDHRCWNPPYAAGWVVVREPGDGPQYLPTQVWHYCCRDCYDARRVPDATDHG